VVIIADDRGDRMIKRIIGLPGESVTLFLGFVYIDGQRLSEPYLPRHTYTFKVNTKDERPADWKLGEKQFFVLGDNRLQSIDSRNFGPVERRGILRVVDLPENTFRPGFCDIILSESGRPMRKSQIRREESL
jgi:signal peptidase I